VVEVPEEEEDKDTADEDGLEVEEEKEKKSKTEKVDKWDWHKLNGNVAIWSREKDSITDEEYQKFFKVISKEPSDALTWIHFKAEVHQSANLQKHRR
jgi:heat shock protein beta